MSIKFENKIREIAHNYIVTKLGNQIQKIDIIQKEMFIHSDFLEKQELLKTEITPKLNSIEKEIFNEMLCFENSLKFDYIKLIEYKVYQMKKQANIIAFFSNQKDFLEDLTMICCLYFKQNENIDTIIKETIRAKIDLLIYENSDIDKKKSKSYNEKNILKKRDYIQPFSKYPIEIIIPETKDEILKRIIAIIDLLSLSIKKENTKFNYPKTTEILNQIVLLISGNNKLPKNYERPAKKIIENYSPEKGYNL